MKKICIAVFSFVLSLSFLTNYASAQNNSNWNNKMTNNRMNPMPITTTSNVNKDNEIDLGWVGLLGLAGLLGLRRKDRDDRK
jgi:hypothetical protein